MVEEPLTIHDLADATGFLLDRTQAKEKVVGQAWLIAKSKVLTLASSVANYAEAPWALLLKFPHPGLNFAVRTVTLHPDFNKREYRNYYLTSNSSHSQQEKVFEYDIATLTIDLEIFELEPERVAELNRALSLPLVANSQDLSGVMRAGDIPNVIKNALMTRRSGLLTLFTETRNIPFARIAINQGKIAKVLYGKATNELALCELFSHSPAGIFIFQTLSNFSWPNNILEINTPTEQLMLEANRRAEELPRIVDALGGPHTRFLKSESTADFNQISPGAKWIAERLWACLDGFLALSQLPDRVPADSYSILKTLWEMRTQGLVTTSSTSPFHHNGQLGHPLPLGLDQDLTAWDSLTAFYLDPISYAPIAESGHFFGIAHLTQDKTLLHTVVLPSDIQGAVILHQGAVIGVHNGPFVKQPGQMLPPVSLNQMTWIGALSDTNTRLRKIQAESWLEQELPLKTEKAKYPDELNALSSAASKLRSKMGTSLLPEDIAMPIGAEEGQSTKNYKLPWFDKFSKLQIIGIAAGFLLLGIIMMISSFFTAQHSQVNSSAVTTGQPSINGLPPKEPSKLDKAIAIAKEYAGFKEVPIEPYQYEDTSSVTNPENTPPAIQTNSFGLSSKRENQKVLFVVWPDTAPLSDLKWLTGKVPFYDFVRVNGDQGYSESNERITWSAGHYTHPQNNKPITVLVAAFPSTYPNKCILVIGQPFIGEGNLDYKLTLSLIDRMFAKSPSLTDNSTQ